MSKVKESMLRSSDLQMEYYSKFMDFVYDNLVSNELSDEDINRLEEEKGFSGNSSSAKMPVSKNIVSKLAVNNIKYSNELQGA